MSSLLLVLRRMEEGAEGGASVAGEFDAAPTLLALAEVESGFLRSLLSP